MSNESHDARMKAVNNLMWELSYRTMDYKLRNELYKKYKKYIARHYITSGIGGMKMGTVVIESDPLIRKVKIMRLFGLVE